MSSCDFTVCNPVLSVGPDTIIFDESKSLHWNVLAWLKNTSYSEVQRKKANGLKFGFKIPIEGVETPFDLDSNFSEEHYNKLQEAIDSGNILYFSDNTLTHFVSKIYNPERYQAWLACIQEVSRTCTGLQPDVRYSGNEVVITLKFITDNSEETFPKVENFYVPPNATCTTGCLSVGEIIGNERIILITRNNDEQGTIIIDTNKGGVSIKLKEPDPGPKPRDKIVISESERETAIKTTYDYVLNKWIEKNGNLGPGGIIKVEKFDVDESKIKFKILVRYVLQCFNPDLHGPHIRNIPMDNFMEDTIDLENLDELDNKDMSVTFNIRRCIEHEDLTLFIPLRELAEKILSVVN
ncbi:hypothetical protein PDN57_28665 [Bacillus cereus]|nr:hypothetical protein [Bacillus cereus]MDA2225495.1 hypothetical protein [Bacillus cereus]